MDEVIDRELIGLREPVESRNGMGDAIRKMQGAPVRKGPFAYNWPIGIGSVAIGALAVFVIGSITTAKAYAGELKAISMAQKGRKTVYQKAFMYNGAKVPKMVTELWLDLEKMAFRQYGENGNLLVTRSSDGKQLFTYISKEQAGGRSAYAEVQDDHSEHFSVDSIDALLTSEFFSQRKIEKTSGVKLNGITCDYYNLANGYYRIWVDPKTKLPLKREVYDHCVTLWERDIYEYPASFADSTFKPYHVDGVPYVRVTRWESPSNTSHDAVKAKSSGNKATTIHPK